MSQRNSCATIKDLKGINRMIDRIRAKPCKVMFGKIGCKEDLVMYGLSDASYNMDDKSLSGILVLLGNKATNVAVPIYWKSKMMVKVCHSAKAAETQSVIKIMDDIQFFAIQVEQLLYGIYDAKIPIKNFTDSKPL
jgi:hypothetical protein